MPKILDQRSDLKNIIHSHTYKMRESGEVRGAERNGGDKLYAELLAMGTWYTGQYRSGRNL